MRNLLEGKCALLFKPIIGGNEAGKLLQKTDGLVPRKKEGYRNDWEYEWCLHWRAAGIQLRQISILELTQFR
jgi:hypothetical protein